MRRILITDEIKNYAGEYAKRMEKGKIPKKNIKNLYSNLAKCETSIRILLKKASKGHPAKYTEEQKGDVLSKPSSYVQTIIDKYSGLNNLLPSKYEDITKDFDHIIPHDEISKYQINLDGKSWQPLYELIVDAMGYSKVQKVIMPEYISKIGIKTCVYCNAQFAITAKKQSTRTRKKASGETIEKFHSSYDLDHNKPKSKYPFLCTNFYNLQPCCSSCNRKKGSQSLDFSLYYEEGDVNTRPLHFVLNRDDIIKFRTSNDRENIVPWLCNSGQNTPPPSSDKKTPAGEFNDKLCIQDIYKEHTDVVEEVLWCHKIYSNGYLTALNNQLPQLGISGFDLKRFLLGGFYTNDNDVLKRPLSVMKEDIWEQLNDKINNL